MLLNVSLDSDGGADSNAGETSLKILKLNKIRFNTIN